MASFNRCEFIGNLGKAPEAKYLPSGDAVCNFSIAVNESWKDKNSGEKKEKTTWVPIVVFGKLAEICAQYLNSGSQIFIAGKFNVRKWQDKDGSDRYSTEIHADEMVMLGGKQSSDSAPAPRQNAAKGASKPAPNFDDMDDSIPF
jgi:single-strand DNA-binding protein